MFVGWIVTMIPGTIGQPCDFRAVDARKVGVLDTRKKQTAWSKLVKAPFIMKHGFNWKDRFGKQHIVATSLGNMTVRMTEKINLQSATGTIPDQRRMKLSDWMDAAGNGTAPPYVFNLCQGSCIQHLAHSVPIPELMKYFSWNFFLSIGNEGPAIPLHAHHLTWVAQLSGTKSWRVAPPGQPPAAPFHNYGLKTTTAQFQRCTQREGDIVFLPEGWWHSTENFDWSFAYGGQGATVDVAGSDYGLAFPVVIGNLSALQSTLKSDSSMVDLSTVVQRDGSNHVLRDVLQTAALKNGHAEVLKLLRSLPSLQSDGPLDQKLAEAVRFGHADVTKWLLQSSESTPEFSKTMLHELLLHSVVGGEEEVMRMLLDARADAVRPIAEIQPLHLAAMYGHTSMARLLMQQGASDVTDSEGRTALDYASGRGPPGPVEVVHHELIKLLSHTNANHGVEL